MKVSPFFSIIIPTFNAEKTIGPAIQSIIIQKFANFELIIADGLSSDRTLEIVQGYQDSRIGIFSEKDKSIYDAMNKALERASGEWIYFLGADDRLYADNILQQVADVVKESDVDAIYGNVFRSATNQIYDGEFEPLSFLTKNISHQALFLKKSLFTKFGFFDLKYKLLSDWDFNLKWFLDTSVKKQYVNITIAEYSDEGLSSRIVDREFLEDLPQKFLKLVDKRAIPDKLIDKLLLDIAIRKRSKKQYFSFGLYKIRYWGHKIFAK